MGWEKKIRWFFVPEKGVCPSPLSRRHISEASFQKGWNKNCHRWLWFNLNTQNEKIIDVILMPKGTGIFSSSNLWNALKFQINTLETFVWVRACYNFYFRNTFLATFSQFYFWPTSFNILILILKHDFPGAALTTTTDINTFTFTAMDDNSSIIMNFSNMKEMPVSEPEKKAIVTNVWTLVKQTKN